MQKSAPENEKESAPENEKESALENGKESAPENGKSRPRRTEKSLLILHKRGGEEHRNGMATERVGR